MKQLLGAALITAGAGLTGLSNGADAATGEDFVVTGDRVNLRGRPAEWGEVVGQLDSGDSVEVLGMTNGWARIVPPDEVGLWVHGDFVDDGRVQVAKLNVRAGSSINYPIVGRLLRGDEVRVRGSFAEWLEIDPPPGSALWISAAFVDPVRPPEPEPEPDAPAGAGEEVRPAAPDSPPLRAGPPTAVEPLPPPPKPVQAEAAEETPPPPPDLELVPLEGQGKTVQRIGTLARAGFLFGPPAKYRLVREIGQMSETITYVKGDAEQLGPFLGARIKIRGREYWIQGEDDPILVPEQIRTLRSAEQE